MYYTFALISNEWHGTSTMALATLCIPVVMFTYTMSFSRRFIIFIDIYFQLLLFHATLPSNKTNKWCIHVMHRKICFSNRFDKAKKNRNVISFIVQFRLCDDERELSQFHLRAVTSNKNAWSLLFSANVIHTSKCINWFRAAKQWELPTQKMMRSFLPPWSRHRWNQVVFDKWKYPFHPSTFAYAVPTPCGSMCFMLCRQPSHIH